MPVKEKIIYLSFDDGPHPEATVFVLEELKKFNAKATFFCIGKNVEAHPATYRKVLEAGHSIGNHTHNHLNGWKTTDQEYLSNISLANHYIHSNLFRPPYGKATRRQLKALSLPTGNFIPIMWTVLSGDFDETITGEKCLDNVIQNTGEGAIVVFHDSEKAFAKLQYALPKVLEYFSEKGFRFEIIKL